MSDQARTGLDENLLKATIRLNTVLFAAVCALLAGLTLLVATYASLVRGQPHHELFLELLGVFLPGYSVTVEGAWIGLAWGALVGAVFGAIMYRVYARGIRGEVEAFLRHDVPAETMDRKLLRLDGNSLGLALGTVAALGLLATTNWLVLRGTAAESVHAALLSQYLPGYTVSPVGSLVGAAEVFVLSYAACHLLAAVYNGVSRWRGRRRS